MRLSTVIGIGAIVFFSVAALLIKLGNPKEATVCIAVAIVFMWHSHRSYVDDDD